MTFNISSGTTDKPPFSQWVPDLNDALFAPSASLGNKIYSQVGYLTTDGLE
jgi:hypothetical protein